MGCSVDVEVCALTPGPLTSSIEIITEADVLIVPIQGEVGAKPRIEVAQILTRFVQAWSRQQMIDSPQQSLIDAYTLGATLLSSARP
jgi:hypothetical protein